VELAVLRDVDVPCIAGVCEAEHTGPAPDRDASLFGGSRQASVEAASVEMPSRAKRSEEEIASGEGGTAPGGGVAIRDAVPIGLKRVPDLEIL